jgi:hypothetical protein
MAVEFYDDTLGFQKTTGTEAHASFDHAFSTRVKSARAVMRGFHIKFDNNEHPLLEHTAKLQVSINGNVVTINGTLMWRDNSGNIDDPFEGEVDYTIIAEV